MYKLCTNNLSVSINVEGGFISSLMLGERECCVGKCPLFVIRLRDKDGECHYINSTMALSVGVEGSFLTYKGFGESFRDLEVRVLAQDGEQISWQIATQGVPCEFAIEWIEVAKVCMPRLIANNPYGGKMLFPYNEGMLVFDETLLPRYEPEFPSSGAYFAFPNMVCSQFMAYLFDDIGLYIGAHDEKRGFKCVDFYGYDGALSLQMRLYSGVGYGEDYCSDFPIVWKACGGNWKSATEIYRSWLREHLPIGVTPISENISLPEWYKESPLIVTYPVRGVHDMDTMEPNALFPYTNALPILKGIKEATKCRIMALLMHWEGTAPWAPPYVWPPYGGKELFNEFRDALHKDGDLLGVYCSGFGYTKQSTLIESYNTEAEIERRGVLRGVCHSPKNKPELGITCTPYQRYGYDICPASSVGREILDEAYSPLFKSGVDYAQILDQNHGGGQYMCYAREHSHPPMPGEWMTSNMQSLLTDWQDKAKGMLFGCESASAEPFIGKLLMSDNRFELNYPYGAPVPVYAYLYHEYVRNFMGNQCGCPFEPKCDTLRYRLGYSFSIGDIMTLILAPNGSLMTHWGNRDFEHSPDMEKTLLFISNLTKFYNEVGKEYLCFGKMSNAPDIECESIAIPQFRGQAESVLPRLLSSCWEACDSKTAYIVVNPESTPVPFSIEGNHFVASPLTATLVLR